jgi:hypothetical protein
VYLLIEVKLISIFNNHYKQWVVGGVCDGYAHIEKGLSWQKASTLDRWFFYSN